MSKLSVASFDIPEIAADQARSAVGENVSKSSIVLAAFVALICRYTGCEKIKLNVKTSILFSTIEIDAASAFIVGDLFKQTHLKLSEAVSSDINRPSTDTSFIVIEQPGDVMRPVMSSIKESADSEAMLAFICENAIGGKSACKFIFSENYYSGELVRQMVRHLNNILSHITVCPDGKIKDIAMLGTEERTKIFEQGTGTVVETGEICAHHFFEEQAAKNPKATALICGKQRMSYEELNAGANAIGRYLQGLGSGKGAIVGIGMERSIEAVVCILAIFKTGAAYTIVSPELPAARINEMLSEAQVSILITKSIFKANFVYEGLRVIDYDQFADGPKENTANVVSGVTVDDAAYITFTSGSTGKPKGIAGMHHSIATLLYYSRFFYKEGTSGEVSALLSPLSFGASVCGVFMPLCNGIPLVLIPDGEEKDPYKFARYVGEHDITSFIITTALARLLCGLKDEGKKLLKSVKHVGIGGSEVTPDLLRAVKLIMPNITITAGYSCSEIGLAAFDRLIEDADLKENERIPMGRPGPNSLAYVLDRDMNIVPYGVPGELYVAAPYLSSGYVGMPELTAQRFFTNPFTDSVGVTRMYRTGDMVRFRFDGEFEYLGRMDSEVKIRGFRIETKEIESVLRNHAEIEEAIVTVEKGTYSERLVAWVVRKAEAETDIPEFRRHIKKYLPAYMVPSIFVFTKKLPLNANGKIDRLALSFNAAEHATGTGEYKGPRNQLESIIAGIWVAIFEVESIGIHDDFLDLGGESLQAAIISMIIWERFSIKIPMIMFYEGMTVATLAEEIYQIQEGSD